MTTKIDQNDPKKKTTKTEQETEINDAISMIRKKFGNESIMKLGDKPSGSHEIIHTGSLKLDIALGIGGLPTGRIIEIYGQESAGKTTFTLHVISEAQKAGKSCVFIDVEHALDPDYAAALGVNTSQLIISQPDYGEQALEMAEELIKTGKIGLLVIDSVAALVPKQELEGTMEDMQMGLLARLMSKALRKITALVSQTNTTVIFINQLRSKINQGGYGPSETTTGGNALKYYASVRMSIKKISTLKKGDEPYGARTLIEVKKNKVSPPFKVAELDIIFGKGFNRMGEILELACEKGIITRSGSWFSYNDVKLGQGADNACAYLQKNKDLLNEIEKKVMAIYSDKETN